MEALPTTQHWLLLVHQIAPKPDYLRVKVRRRLQRIGAIAIKNTVYALPDREQQAEDLAWLAKEIESDGGDAYLCKASFVAGLTDDAVVRLFNTARNEDYANIARSLDELLSGVSAPSQNEAARVKLRGEIRRLHQAMAEIAAIDFFEAGGRETCLTKLEQLEARTMLQENSTTCEILESEYFGRTWVTRAHIFVDRMASAWAIRRYIDLEARFRFVDPEGYRQEPGEIRFDMFEGEYTHVGKRCTFEVLRDRFSLDAPGLSAIAEIVHDIDLKETLYDRPETAGVQAVLAGIRAGSATDDQRLQQGMALFDALLLQLAAENTAHG